MFADITGELLDRSPSTGRSNRFSHDKTFSGMFLFNSYQHSIMTSVKSAFAGTLSANLAHYLRRSEVVVVQII
jgi:hypothetical protein